MKIVGIDIGTTTISGVVLESKTAKNIKIIESKTIENACFITSEKNWERIQDADEIIKKARKMLDYFLDKYPHIERIGLTGQMHGIVYIDGNGKCVSPLYTWQDARGNLRDENNRSLTEEILKQCGVKAAAGYGAVTHIYNLRHNLIPDAAGTICTIMDYFGMCLTGRRRPLVHTSNSASFGFFDGRYMRFMTEQLNEMGVDGKWLPHVCTQIEELGRYKNCIVTTAIGDNQASFLGAVGNEDNALLINMGTGGQISILSKEYFAEDGIEARPFIDGKYLLAGASLCGGKAYALLEKFFRKFMKEASGQEMPLYGILEKLARDGKELNNKCSEQMRLKVETTFDGTRANPEICGSIMNLSSENFTPEAFAYGVLEGMGMELYRMYQTIHAGTLLKVDRMIGSGNGLRKNPILCDIIEELFGAKLLLAECEEEAAVGAAVSSLMLSM